MGSKSGTYDILISLLARNIKISANVQAEAGVGTAINIRSMSGSGGIRQQPFQGDSDAMEIVSSKVGSLPDAMVAKMRTSPYLGKVEEEEIDDPVEQWERSLQALHRETNATQTASDKVFREVGNEQCESIPTKLGLSPSKGGKVVLIATKTIPENEKTFLL